MNIIISFPNSGRTWLSAMLEDLRVDCWFAHMGSQHNGELTMNQIIKQMELNPNKFDNDNIILLHREPKDTLVSKHLHSIHRVGYSFSLADFIRNPKQGLSKLIEFNLYWKKFNRCNKNISISYEELSGDTFLNLKKVCNYFGYEPTDDSIQNAIDNNTLKEMQYREVNGVGHKYYYKHTDKNNPESYKIRKGKVGGYTDYMTPEDVEYCDKVLTEYNYREKMNV